MNEIEELANLIRQRNQVAKEITRIVGRPALIGHVGEYIASKIFNIRLEESATAKGIDGVFEEDSPKGKTVNIKFYTKREGLLDIREDALPDYYLVFTGPKGESITSRGEARPWHVDWVFLFDAQKLMVQLRERGVKIGIATSLINEQWDQAEIYPNQVNTELLLSEDQRNILQLFGSEASEVGYRQIS